MGCFSPMVAGLNRVNKNRFPSFASHSFKVMKYFYNVLPDINGVINSTYRAFCSPDTYWFSAIYWAYNWIRGPPGRRKSPIQTEESLRNYVQLTRPEHQDRVMFGDFFSYFCFVTLMNFIDKSKKMAIGIEHDQGCRGSDSSFWSPWG